MSAIAVAAITGASVAGTAALATAGIGIAGAAGAFAPSAPAAPNVGQMTADQINAEIAAVPANYQAQLAYNPQFAALNSTIAWQNLFGSPAGTSSGTTQVQQTGWYDANGNYLGPSSMYSAAPAGGSPNGFANNPGGGHGGPAFATAGQNPPGNTAPQPPSGARLYNQGDTIPQTNTRPAAPGSLATAEAAQPRLLAMQTNSRAQDISDVAQLGPAAYQAMRSYNPQVTSLYDTMDKQATDLVNTNGALDPFTQMALQQNYRGAEAARGMAGSNSDAAMEAYYQAATQYQRQIQNLQTAGQVAGQTAGYYGDPFQQVLSRTSGGVQVPGQSYTASQPSAVGDTASLLNSQMTQLQGVGYNAQNQANIAGYNSQQQFLGGLIQPNAQGNSGLSSMMSGLASYF